MLRHNLEIDAVTGAKRCVDRTAGAEVWLAYLHLVNAKQRVKSREVVGELDEILQAAKEVLGKLAS
jgi:hypothetical protein